MKEYMTVIVQNIASTEENAKTISDTLNEQAKDGFIIRFCKPVENILIFILEREVE